MGQKINVGIIGCGQIATKAHIPNLNTIPNVRIRALCSRSEESLYAANLLCGDKDVRLYRRSEDLLADNDIDAVLICVPNDIHAQEAMQALDAQKHVFLEKPLATTTADAQAIVRKVRSSNKILQVGYEFHYSEVIRQTKKIVQEGTIGRIKLMHMKVTRFPLRSGWRDNPLQSGGVMLELNSHFLQLFTEFADAQPLVVFGVGDTSVDTAEKLIDNCIVTLLYPHHIKASLSMCLLDPYEEIYILEIIGTKGSITVDLLQGRIDCALFTNHLRSTIQVLPTPGEKEAMHPGTRAQLVAFLDAIASHTMPEIDAEAAAHLVSLSVAIDKSIATHTLQKVEQIALP